MSTQAGFFAAVEQDLLLWHVPFDRCELRTFLADVAPLIEPDDAPEVWATTFLEAMAHNARGALSGRDR